MQNVAKKHEIRIAIKTLRLSEIGAQILGGMNHEKARQVLREAGWSDQRIQDYED